MPRYWTQALERGSGQPGWLCMMVRLRDGLAWDPLALHSVSGCGRWGVSNRSQECRRSMRATEACNRLVIPAKGRDVKRVMHWRRNPLLSQYWFARRKRNWKHKARPTSAVIKDTSSQSSFVLHFKSQPKAPNHETELIGPCPTSTDVLVFGQVLKKGIEFSW